MSNTLNTSATSDIHLDLPEAGERRLALVIGVDEAPSALSPQLSQRLCATSDAQAIADVLTERCGFTLFREPLLDEQASSHQVKRAMLELARERTDNDFLLLYFAGHGLHQAIEADQQDTYLVTHDFNEQEVQDDNNLHLSMKWLHDKLYIPTHAGKVLLILDCCYAGAIAGQGEDSYLAELQQRINTYFGAQSKHSGIQEGGLHMALAATAHNRLAYEEHGHGRLTGHLLDVLRGEVDGVIDVNDHGYVKLLIVRDYLQQVMPQEQKPVLAGTDAGRVCILAQYAQRAEELRLQRRTTINERPHSYIPMHRSDSYYPRPGEFEHVLHLLMEEQSEQNTHHGTIVGLIGMGGVGKTQLAVELAYYAREHDLFPAGIFCLTTTSADEKEVRRLFADLTANTDYLPAGDNISHPENEQLRARHFCRYLAQHPDALLILDNVDQIAPLLDLFPLFAGEEMRCTILFTSRNAETRPFVHIHHAAKLPADEALHILLAYRADLLERALQGEHDAEITAARHICAYVDFLPLALTRLRDLLQESTLTLEELWQQQQQHGTIYVTREGEDILKERLFRTFEQSWLHVRSPQAQRLFKYAVSFPTGTQIPLWLLGLVADVEGNTSSLDPLGRARRELLRWSLIEDVPHTMISLHPLIREFGHYLIAQDATMKEAAQTIGERLQHEFANIDRLQQRVQAKGYWATLDDLDSVLLYARSASLPQAPLLERVRFWLARDSSLLSTQEQSTQPLSTLLYQQLSNHAVEEGYILEGTPPSTPWFQQLQPVHAEDQALLLELRHPDSVTSLGFSPDDRFVVTGCDDGIARIWSIATGQLVRALHGHDESVSCVEYAPEGDMIVTGSADGTVRLWRTTTGEQLHSFHEQDERKNAFTHARFSASQDRILAITDNAQIYVWDSATEKTLAIFVSETEPFRDASFFLDTNTLLTLSHGNRVQLWDIASECEIKGAALPETFAGHSVFFHNNHLILREGLHFQWWSWQGNHWSLHMERSLSNLKELSYLPLSADSIADIAPQSRRIALSYDDYIAEVVDLQAQARISYYQHTDVITSVSFSHAGILLGTSALDSTARIWNTDLGTNSLESFVAAISRILLSADSMYALVIRFDGPLTIWRTQEQQQVATIAESLKYIDSFVLAPSGTRFAVAASDMVYIFPLSSDLPTMLYAEHTLKWRVPKITRMCFSRDGKELWATTDSSLQRIWYDASDAAGSREKRASLKLPRIDGRISTLSFQEDGQHIIAGTSSGKLFVFDLMHSDYTNMQSNYAIARVDTLEHTDLIAIGTVNGLIELWQQTRRQRLAVLNGHKNSVEQVAFSPDGRFLLSGDRNGTILLWDLPAFIEANDWKNIVHPTLTPIASYHTSYEPGALRWLDEERILVIDKGGPYARPFFYHLRVTGSEQLDKHP